MSKNTANYRYKLKDKNEFNRNDKIKSNSTSKNIVQNKLKDKDKVPEISKNKNTVKENEKNNFKAKEKDNVKVKDKEKDNVKVKEKDNDKVKAKEKDNVKVKEKDNDQVNAKEKDKVNVKDNVKVKGDKEKDNVKVKDKEKDNIKVKNMEKDNVKVKEKDNVKVKDKEMDNEIKKGKEKIKEKGKNKENDKDSFNSESFLTANTDDSASLDETFFTNSPLRGEGPHNDTIALNVSGERFEVERSVIERHPFIYRQLLDDVCWIEETQEYFLERDPVVFTCVLAYLQSGQLHLPKHICGPLLDLEINSWGVSFDTDIQRCCIGPVIQTLQKSKMLLSFEENHLNKLRRTPHHVFNCEFWRKCSKFLWVLIERPRMSYIGIAYGILSILFSVMAIYIVMVFDVNYPSLTLMCIAFFTMDLAFRLVCAVTFLEYFSNPLHYIDILNLIAFCIYYQNISNLLDKRRLESFMRICTGLIPPFLVLKMIRAVKFHPSLVVLFYTLKVSVRNLFFAAIILCCSVVIFAILINIFESQTFTSFFVSLWWSMITITRIGYGDIAPTTGIGYTIGGLCCFSGLIVCSISIPIVADNFGLLYSHAMVYTTSDAYRDEEEEMN